MKPSKSMKRINCIRTESTNTSNSIKTKAGVAYVMAAEFGTALSKGIMCTKFMDLCVPAMLFDRRRKIKFITESTNYGTLLFTL
jgi:hypothetical protein